MAIREHPELFLVRPNIGQPLILLQGQLDEGFTLTFAGKTDWTPTHRECLQWIKGDSLWLKKNGLGHFDLWVTQVTGPRRVSPPRNDPPLSATEFQYKAGFRWEFDVKIEAHPHIPPQDWPQMLDITFYHKYWDPDQQEWVPKETRNRHAVYVDERFSSNVDSFTLLHVTDLHVARRNDRIPEILAEVRDESEIRELLQRYRNFNDNLRGVIAYANEQVGKGKLVLLIATGDLVDYYHDGVFAWDKGKARWSKSNFTKLIDIITGRDARGEALRCPILLVLGNHDYLPHEPPLCIDVELLGLIKARDKDSYETFGLTHGEGREYDYWWQGCPVLPFIPGLGPGTSEIERRKFIKKRGGWDIDLSHGDAYKLGQPHYDHLAAFTQHVNYDTDFTFNVGPHQFVCLNTGPDIYPSMGEMLQDELFGGLSDAKKDYLSHGPHNRGITQYHLDQLKKALQSSSHDGLVFCFTHAPLLSLHKDRTEGMETFFEDEHSEAPPPPNDITIWLAKHMSTGWATGALWPCLKPGALEGDDQFCREKAYEYFKGKGYPQAGTAYFKRGKRDSILNFSCADGKVQEFFGLIAPTSTATFPVSGTGGRRKLALLLSGHTHKIHEFRIEGPRTPPEVGRFISYFFLDDYSGSQRRFIWLPTAQGTMMSYESEHPTAHSLGRAHDKEKWLAAHAPLLVTSGALKRESPEFREIVVEGNIIKVMEMKRLPKLEPEEPKPGEPAEEELVWLSALLNVMMS